MRSKGSFHHSIWSTPVARGSLVIINLHFPKASPTNKAFFFISSQKLCPSTKDSKVEKRKMCAPEFQSHNSYSVKWGKQSFGIFPCLFPKLPLYVFTFYSRTQPKITSSRWQENFLLIEIKWDCSFVIFSYVKSRFLTAL